MDNENQITLSCLTHFCLKYSILSKFCKKKYYTLKTNKRIPFFFTEKC